MTDLSLAPVLLQLLYLFGIWLAIAESPIDPDQLSVRNANDGTLTSSSELDSLITGEEKRVLFACRRPTRLRQHTFQPPVALPGFPATTFPALS
jgi:hypothetical protein